MQRCLIVLDATFFFSPHESLIYISSPSNSATLLSGGKVQRLRGGNCSGEEKWEEGVFSSSPWHSCRFTDLAAFGHICDANEGTDAWWFPAVTVGYTGDRKSPILGPWFTCPGSIKRLLLFLVFDWFCMLLLILILCLGCLGVTVLFVPINSFSSPHCHNLWTRLFSVFFFRSRVNLSQMLFITPKRCPDNLNLRKYVEVALNTFKYSLYFAFKLLGPMSLHDVTQGDTQCVCQTSERSVAFVRPRPDSLVFIPF